MAIEQTKRKKRTEKNTIHIQIAAIASDDDLRD